MTKVYMQVLMVLLSMMLGAKCITDKMCKMQLKELVQTCVTEFKWRSVGSVSSRGGYDYMTCTSILSKLEKCKEEMETHSSECICSGIELLRDQEEVIEIKDKYEKCSNRIDKMLKCNSATGSMYQKKTTIQVIVLLFITALCYLSLFSSP